MFSCLKSPNHLLIQIFYLMLQSDLCFSHLRDESNEVSSILIITQRHSGQGEQRPPHKDIKLNISEACHL